MHNAEEESQVIPNLNKKGHKDDADIFLCRMNSTKLSIK